MAINNQFFYKASLKKHGISVQGLSWNSVENQEIRFSVLTQFIAKELLTCSVVDAGCGFGDLYLFWQKMGLKPKNYIGIDSFDKFITIANRRIANAVFLQRDILKDSLPMADWYIASGSLNLLSDFETWLFLEKMLLHAQKGIVFNILCGEKKSKIYNYKTEKQIETFIVQKGLTCKIVVGYLKNDMSVLVKKEKKGVE
ncbi:MAG: class I SAM-dependent methyltransferase [Sulfurospirillum sp.]|nr:class I SAM-dependent methyltransferase [Sulfurospirillum sp.]